MVELESLCWLHLHHFGKYNCCHWSNGYTGRSFHNLLLPDERKVVEGRRGRSWYSLQQKSQVDNRWDCIRTRKIEEDRKHSRGTMFVVALPVLVVARLRLHLRLHLRLLRLLVAVAVVLLR